MPATPKSRAHDRTDARARARCWRRLFPLAVHAAGDPAFLAQLAGTSLGASDTRRRAVFLGAASFVVGFSVVFAALGVALNAMLAGAATEVLAWLSRVAGAVVILLGLHLTGLVRLPFLDREYAARPKGSPGLLAPFLFGASFAVA